MAEREAPADPLCLAVTAQWRVDALLFSSTTNTVVCSTLHRDPFTDRLQFETQMDKYESYEKYEAYDTFAEEMWGDDGYANRRVAERSPSRDSVPADLAELSDSAADFVPTYARQLDPHHYERQWVIDSVAPFYHDNVITDVTRRVKAGKEANVYCCTGNPATGLPLLAAKLYRPRILRTLKNDAIYKAGRMLRGEDGKLLKGRREKLALRQKSRFGRQVDSAWWIGNEFRAQQTLFDAGADVPQPVAHAGNTILMAYIGDEDLPAPPLSDVTLKAAEAQTFFDLAMENVALMLDNHVVHGDLSAYNILMWQDAIQIIDFPQIVDARLNPYAFTLLVRDITRLVDYFGRFGVEADPLRLADDLWVPYMGARGELLKLN